MDSATLQLAFPPTQAEALARLDAFSDCAGWRYAANRNDDPGPRERGDTSVLSPYLRRRMVDERAVVMAVIHAQGSTRAAKFIEEVCWRTYWKGWLQTHPTVWTRFCRDRDTIADGLTSGAAKTLASAESGEAGIEGFDDWVRELVATGWLHNHARMWFASIWVFTLGLPWQLGADFFLRHLVDADPASNTLSWRWVAGLQTRGKTYLATAGNIARYTGGRFEPKNLATKATALREDESAPLVPLPEPAAVPDGKALLLVTDEDLTPDWLGQSFSAALVAGSTEVGQRGLRGATAAAFARGALNDAAMRLRETGMAVSQTDTLAAEPIIAAAEAAGSRLVVTSFAPVGATAAAIADFAGDLAKAGLTLVQPRRSWDDAFWPSATRGFSHLRRAIPGALASQGFPVETAAR